MNTHFTFYAGFSKIDIRTFIACIAQFQKSIIVNKFTTRLITNQFIFIVTPNIVLVSCRNTNPIIIVIRIYNVLVFVTSTQELIEMTAFWTNIVIVSTVLPCGFQRIYISQFGKSIKKFLLQITEFTCMFVRSCVNWCIVTYVVVHDCCKLVIV